MSRFKQTLGTIFLGTSLLLAIANVGCSGRVRVYDSYHSDWHTWDHNEDVQYRAYLNEHHEPYRDYNKLDKNQQKDYWNYRHEHPDNH